MSTEIDYEGKGALLLVELLNSALSPPTILLFKIQIYFILELRTLFLFSQQ